MKPLYVLSFVSKKIVFQHQVVVAGYQKAMNFAVVTLGDFAKRFVQEFFVQVGLNTAVILLVDKWILGRAQEQAGPTGDSDESFEELWDELPVEVPPGKEGAP